MHRVVGASTAGRLPWLSPAVGHAHAGTSRPSLAPRRRPSLSASPPTACSPPTTARQRTARSVSRATPPRPAPPAPGPAHRGLQRQRGRRHAGAGLPGHGRLQARFLRHGGCGGQPGARAGQAWHGPSHARPQRVEVSGTVPCEAGAARALSPACPSAWPPAAPGRPGLRERLRDQARQVQRGGWLPRRMPPCDQPTGPAWLGALSPPEQPCEHPAGASSCISMQPPSPGCTQHLRL